MCGDRPAVAAVVVAVAVAVAACTTAGGECLVEFVVATCPLTYPRWVLVDGYEVLSPVVSKKREKSKKNLSRVKRRPKRLTNDDQIDNVTMMVTRVLPSA